MQSVFSIPLGTGVKAAPGTLLRDRSACGTLVGEFIAGPENRLAAHAVKAVFEGKTQVLMPLVLYGPSQSGKTHLARGLADWWQHHHPSAKVLVVTGAEFGQQYADAVDTDQLTAWRSGLRRVQMLVIDDLAGIAGKRGAQQELRCLLDDLLDADALVVVTTRALPSVSNGLTESLQSRFSAGLAIPVHLPGVTARQVMIERFAEARGVSISKRAAHALAESLKAPAPMLLGALMELELSSRSAGVAPVLDAEHIRRYLTSQSRETPITIRDIATAAGKYFNLKLADLKSPSRRKAIVTARNMAVYLARQLTDQSLTQIGEYFGGRDHTTILHGLRKTEQLAKRDPATSEALSEIKRMIAMNR